MKFETKEDFLKCIRNELVPENPKTGFGIEGLIEYRINGKNKLNKRHPDSIFEGYDESKQSYYGTSITAKYFKDIYKIDPLKVGSSDTIFNCWSYLSMFARGRLNKKSITEIEVKQNLDIIFERYELLKNMFDKLADYQHSMANLMPAPIGFNGSSSHDGKGQYNRDNDMPDIYYSRSINDFPAIRKWIDENMEEYALRFFKEYSSGFYDRKANISTLSQEQIVGLQESIDRAIKCIENRAEDLERVVKILTNK